MAETPQNAPAPQKAELPPVVEENGIGGKSYRVFQKQDPNAATWESHVGSMLGSLAYVGLYTGGVIGTAGTAAAGAAAAAATSTFVLPGVVMVGLGLALSFGAGWIGQKIGSARVERENKEGKLYGKPTMFNRDAVENGLSGMFLWKLLGLAVAGIASWYLGSGFIPDAVKNPIAHTAVMTASWGAAALGGIKGVLSGMSQGKARMVREYEDLELIHAIETGKGVPQRILNDKEGPAIGPAAGIVSNVVTTVDPGTIIHSIPGILGEKMPEAGMQKPGKIAHDFSYLGDAHPAANRPKISFSDRESAKAAAKEQGAQATIS
ncbi:MAG: hypothetical protein U1E36_00515 [Rickettsiales bacterium]